MDPSPVALIVGATGLSGSYTARRLKAADWTVVTLSRGDARLPESDRHIAADLTDPAKTEQALASCADVTHVFYCTWSLQPNEAENCRVNKAMIQHLFNGLPVATRLQHVGLVTGLKHYLGSFEDYASAKPYTPFLETQPRLPGLNFYYELEDVLFAEADKRGFNWAVHRPHTLIGLAIGNAMNMAVTLSVYASICRETGMDFVFPGSPEQYTAATDVTDARILAEQLHWAAVTRKAANLPFNIVNGDVFRWTWLWQQIADYFGLAVGRYPGHPMPLQQRMAEAGAAEIWAGMVAKHTLVDHPIDRLASWWHTDADLGRDMECFTDMHNSRSRGFTAWQRTPESFFAVFDALRARRIIPSA